RQNRRGRAHSSGRLSPTHPPRLTLLYHRLSGGIFSFLQSFLSHAYWASRLRRQGGFLAESSSSRRALRERRLRELPVQMRYLIWETRRLSPPLIRDELANWTPNALAVAPLSPSRKRSR